VVDQYLQDRLVCHCGFGVVHRSHLVEQDAYESPRRGLAYRSSCAAVAVLWAP
jgi:hypothetical protein